MLEEIERPQPRQGEVLVRVHAAAITRDELEWPVDRLPATGTFVWVPSDGTGPTFTGSFTQRVGENVNTQDRTETVLFRLHATGSDGSRFSNRVIFHVTINPLGVEIAFEKPTREQDRSGSTRVSTLVAMDAPATEEGPGNGAFVFVSLGLAPSIGERLLTRPVACG